MLCFPSANLVNDFTLTQPTIWLELAKGLPAAFVAFIIGCIAARIAFNQYSVARAKLNLDLFDKRHHIFQKTWELLSQVSRPNVAAMRLDFTNLIPEASFIFGKNIETYMYEISNKLIEYDTLNVKMQNIAIHPVSEDVPNRIAELADWFYNEASTGSRVVFSEYLDFSKWK